MSSNLLLAQGTPPPPPPGGGGVDDVPIDSHIWIFLLAGVSYGIYNLLFKTTRSEQ